MLKFACDSTALTQVTLLEGYGLEQNQPLAHSGVIHLAVAMLVPAQSTPVTTALGTSSVAVTS